MAFYTLKEGSRSFIREYYTGLHSDILTGNDLRTFAADVPQYRGELYESVKRFMSGGREPVICGVFGPEGTGKRTVMRQVAADMEKDDFDRTAYLITKPGENMYDIDWELDSLESDGFKYVFIENITSMGKFATHASMLSDTYAWTGMKIVVAGSNEVLAWLTSLDTLYCRICMLSSAHVSYRDFIGMTGTEDLEMYMRHYGLAGLSTAHAEDQCACAREYIETEIVDRIYETAKVRDRRTDNRLATLRGLSRDELAALVYDYLEQVCAARKVIAEDRCHREMEICLEQLHVVDDAKGRFYDPGGNIMLLMPWLSAAFPSCGWYGTRDWKERSLMSIIISENRRLYQGEGYDIQCWTKPESAVPCMRTSHSPRFDADRWVYYEELTPYRAFTVLYSDEMDPAPDCVIADESKKEKLNRYFHYRLKRYILYLGKTCTDMSA